MFDWTKLPASFAALARKAEAEERAAQDAKARPGRAAEQLAALRKEHERRGREGAAQLERDLAAIAEAEKATAAARAQRQDHFFADAAWTLEFEDRQRALLLEMVAAPDVAVAAFIRELEADLAAAHALKLPTSDRERWVSDPDPVTGAQRAELRVLSGEPSRKRRIAALETALRQARDAATWASRSDEERDAKVTEMRDAIPAINQSERVHTMRATIPAGKEVVWTALESQAHYIGLAGLTDVVTSGR